jgi:acetyl-CoA/propionyl-CoA carboxylase biotin carboxyl carrier protein
VEFLVADASPDEFFFIEMNTRLQVEHPVTELVTGVDLVEQQLRIAAGEPLSLKQADIRMSGHAIEARIYAESPARDFLPATGTVLALHEPAGEGFRVDSGLVEGLVVGGSYDPMLAKAIAVGADRAEALTRLDALLSGTVVLGLDTNIDELRSVLADPDVRAGRLDTGLLDRRGTPAAVVPDADDLAVAAIVLDAARDAGSGPWTRDGWRANGRRRPARHGIRTAEGVIDVEVDGTAVAIGPHEFRVTHGGETETVHAALTPASLWLRRRARTLELETPDRAARTAELLASIVRAEGPVSPELRSPMPGTVVAVPVADGDRVSAGDTVVTVEAMKMESPLTAPVAGIVRVSVRVGDLVRRDQVVAVIEEAVIEALPEKAAVPTKRVAPKKKDAV